MSIYWITMLIGSAILFALYGLRCARAPQSSPLRRRPWLTAGLSLGFGWIFGLVLARVAYALLMQELDFAYDGWAALEQLTWIEIDYVSFLGGALGVILAVWLANRLTRKGSVLAGLDAFAPFGALLVALFRLGEGFFGSYGAGTILPDNSPFAFFPFATKITVDGGYSYWGWAVFVLSAVFALGCAAMVFALSRRANRPGFAFLLTLFALALPQLLCESLRKRGMFWLFIHVEQLLCGLVVLAVLLVWILQTKNAPSAWSRWWPLALTALCMGLVVAAEFAVDGKLFDLPHTVTYAFMCVVLGVVGFCGYKAVRRWNA